MNLDKNKSRIQFHVRKSALICGWKIQTRELELKGISVPRQGAIQCATGEIITGLAE
jgi:hypothetical protein